LAAAFVASVIVSIAVASLLLPNLDTLNREGGILENAQLISWAFGIALSLWTVLRFRTGQDRMLAAWAFLLTLIAEFRELELQVWLTPIHLGALGRHFTWRWWMDPLVSFWLKLGWGALSLGGFCLILGPPLRLRRSLWQLLRGGDAMTGLLVLAFIFLATEFVIDDLLRAVQLLPPLSLRRTIEEASELIGAVFFCASVALLWRKPFSARLDQVTEMKR
jgi:hypothetical protein